MHHPPEVLCQIFHYAVGDSGIRILFPILHVCYQWRRSALGDSSLWTTIYLSNIAAPPLLDMILTYAGKRLLRVHVDDPNVNREAKLWNLVDKIEELDCSYATYHVSPFLSSLGPAPNLKILRLRDDDPDPADDGHGQQQKLPELFQGCLPSLRELHLAIAVTWPTGLFKSLRSFELVLNPDHPFCSTLVLDVLRESPLLENLHLVCSCQLTNDEPPPVVLSSLKKCALVGNTTLSLIWYMDIPPSTDVFLSTPPILRDETVVYRFENFCLAPSFHVLDEVHTLSFAIRFDTINFHAQNESGGALNVQVHYYKHALVGLTILTLLFKDLFCGFPSKFQCTMVLSLHIEPGASRNDVESVFCATMFSRFIHSTLFLERIQLYGVPAKALYAHLGYLHSNIYILIPFAYLQRVYIETTPLSSPKSLLGDLDVVLRKRNEVGVALQFVDVKVKCERLIPMAEHSAFLTAWKDLVGEDVKVEYFRKKVEKLPRRGPPLTYSGILIHDSESEDEVEGGEADAVESGDCDSEWES